MLIKDDDLNIKYGMINFGDEREMARHSFGYIMKDINNMKNDYFMLGFHLNEFNSNGYYRDFGYASLKEFLVNNTDLEYSMATKCMRVHARFCKYNGATKTMYIEDKYENFNHSQLIEMSNMSNDEIIDIKPDMSVKEIRSIKRKNASGDVATKSDSVIKGKQEEIKNIEIPLLNDLDDGKLDYFMLDLLDLINKECNRVLTQTSAKGKQAWFGYDGKKYKLQLCEVKE